LNEAPRVHHVAGRRGGIVGAGTEAAIAAKQATSSIPIVFPTAGDPIGSGLVASLARPGGNVTGLSNLGTDLAAKRIEILREVFPGLSRLAVMANADYSGSVTERKEIDAAARTLGLEIIPLPIRRVEDIASAFEGLKGRAEALYITGDPLMNLQSVAQRVRMAAEDGRRLIDEWQEITGIVTRSLSEGRPTAST
jgi:putative tryptophan/tyrosine transport system substrate-binding protein